MNRVPKMRILMLLVALVAQLAIPAVTGRQLTGTPAANTVNTAAFPTSLEAAGYPKNPFISDWNICKNLATTPSYTVNGYPSTPVAWKPFTNKFKNTPFAKKTQRVCRPDGHCMSHFEMDVAEVDINIGCSKPTTFMAYGGTVPGPTVYGPEGEEVLVRFNSRLVGGHFSQVDLEPCGEPGRGHGTPISVHGHGQASLAPFDGWAENVICGGESKIYTYPNNRAASGWYHDHSIDITARNAYHGMAGYLGIIKKKGVGANCGEPWNLDNIPDYFLVLNDKLLDNQCQLRMDEGTGQVHENGFYGDINLLSGIPWPVMTVHPTFIRMRMLAGGPTRPWKYALVTSDGQAIAGQKMSYGKTRCQVIASDGGFRPKPVDMPSDGVFHGVAERYEFVCDMSDMAGKTLWLWNKPDNKRTTGDVPFFCFTHLLAKITVLPSCPSTTCDASKPLPFALASETGANEYICKDSNASPAISACCPDGQFCKSVSSTRSVCRSKPLLPGFLASEATCYLPADAEKVDPTSVTSELRCGGTNFGGVGKGKNAAMACCPDTATKQPQFCWNNPTSNGADWLCRPKPKTDSTFVDTIGTCGLDKPEWATGAVTPYHDVIQKVVLPSDLATAQNMANQGKFHRQFVFGRTNGHWTINGETWHTVKVQATDVGENAWELWKLQGGGGWFHPIHIHLVDFWVIRRDGPIKTVETWEAEVGKDVVPLHPSGSVWILARFGPHRGDYMFHCHNLRHEDNAMMSAFRTNKGLDKFNTVATSGISFATLNDDTRVIYDSYNIGGQGFEDPMSQNAILTPSVDSNGIATPLTNQEIKAQLDKDYYRIFYPSATSIAEHSELADTSFNPWLGSKWQDTQTCP